MIGGTRQIVIEDSQRARSKTTGFLQIKVSQKGLGKSSNSVVYGSNESHIIMHNVKMQNWNQLKFWK